MRQEVPQFIDVEDKLFGPLTFKQFLYLVGGGGLAYVAYKLVPFPFSFVVMAPIVIIAIALAFYKMNGRPFVEIMQAWIGFKLKRRLYVWRKPGLGPVEKPKAPIAPETPIAPKPARDTEELARNLDILDM